MSTTRRPSLSHPAHPRHPPPPPPPPPHRPSHLRLCCLLHSHTPATAYSTSLTGALRGTIPLDLTTLVRLVDYDDVRFGFEIVTRDKEAKLHAASVEERDEWGGGGQEVRVQAAAGCRDEGRRDWELEVMQEKANAIESNHPSRAVELESQ